MSLKWIDFFWFKGPGSRRPDSKHPEFKHPESKCPVIQTPSVQSPSVETMRPEFSFYGMPRDWKFILIRMFRSRKSILFLLEIYSIINLILKYITLRKRNTEPSPKYLLLL